MAVANGLPSKADERFAALDERVNNLRSSFNSLEASTARGFAHIDTKLGELANTISAGQRTPWSTIWAAGGVLFSVLLGIGWLVYTPVQQNQTKLEAAVEKVADIVNEQIQHAADNYIPRREQETLRARAVEDRAGLDRDITQLRTEALPRAEWLLRNQAVDGTFADVRHQIEVLRTDFGGTYSLRDAITDLKNRMERIEERPKT